MKKWLIAIACAALAVATAFGTCWIFGIGNPERLQEAAGVATTIGVAAIFFAYIDD